MWHRATVLKEIRSTNHFRMPAFTWSFKFMSFSFFMLLTIIILLINITPTKAINRDDILLPGERIDKLLLRNSESIPTTPQTGLINDSKNIDSAIGPDGRVFIVWECMNNIYMSIRNPGEEGFSSPRCLNSPDDPGMEPKIYVTDQEIIHIIWLSLKDPVKDIKPSFGHQVIWIFSRDGGEKWFCQTIVKNGNYSYPDLVVLPDGNISMTIWNQYPIFDLNGTVIREDYKLLFIKWTSSGHIISKVVITEPCSEPSPQQFLIISGEGNPHILVKEQTLINWYITSDNGDSWKKKEGPLTDSIFRRDSDRLVGGVAFTDDSLIYFLSFKYSENHSRYYFGYGFSYKGKWLTLNDFGDCFDYSLAPILCSVQLKYDAAWFTIAVIIPDSTITNTFKCLIILGNVWLEGGQTVRYSERIITSFQVNDYKYFDNTSDYCPTISIENNVMPTIAQIKPSLNNSSTIIDIWRFNHFPNYPIGESDTDGQWIFSSITELTVKTTKDIDGDEVEYNFSYWNQERTFSASSKWTKYPSFVIMVPHGVYYWSVEVRDSFNYSTRSEEGWWFRIDIEPPRSCAGGPYIFTEGSVNYLDGSGSNDDGPLKLWEWDINEDGIFELNSTVPRIMLKMEDDYSGFVTLRVTDEAGRIAISMTKLMILNVPPTISIEGPLFVADSGNYTAYVSDISIDDSITVKWSVNGHLRTDGLDFHFISSGPGTYYISAMAIDDEGGTSYAFIHVIVPWPTRVPLSIEIPQVVTEGCVYLSKLSSPIPNWTTPQEITWRRWGREIGKGTEVQLIAGSPGIEYIEVGIYSGNIFILGDIKSIKVIEKLRSTVCTNIRVQTYNSILIRWIESNQSEIFDKYIIRLSPEPLPVQPNSDLGWMQSNKNDMYFIELKRSMIEHEFTGLNASWTYHLCIYTVGDDEVACSPSVFATIPPIADSIVTNHSPDKGDNLGWGVFMGLAIVIVVSISAVTIYQRMDDKKRV